MHTVDESSDPSVSLVKLSASDARVCCDSATLVAAQPSSSQFDSRTIAFDQTLHPSQSFPKVLFGSGVAAVGTSFEVPSWKRVLDIACILLSVPVWLPILIFLTLWIKLASPGPIFFRQERVGLR